MMNSLHFMKTEVAAALARGVRQCVTIGSYPTLCEAFKTTPEKNLQVFAVEEEPLPDPPGTLVRTRFASEPLAAALEKTNFDRLKASLFFWLGGAAYRTSDAALASLAFIASLPSGSGVVLDYAVERTGLGSLTQTALDALASRVTVAGSSVKHLIQPQAVSVMLRSLGFRHIVDLAQDELHVCGGHFVSAIV